MRTYPKPRRAEVFAVAPSAVQLTQRALPPGLLRVRIGPAEVERQHAGGPTAVTVGGLEPGTEHPLTADLDGQTVTGWPSTVSTPKTPGGELLSRIGSLNDVHIGAGDFGLAHSMREEPQPAVVSSVRCAEAAADALEDWGAEHLFIKGDLIHQATPSEWADAARIFGFRPWENHITWGNHERVDEAACIDGVALVGAEPVKPVAVTDLPGLRVILADSSIAGSNRGSVAGVTDEIVALAGESDTPVLLFTHHNLQPRKFAWMLPSGVSATEATPLLDALDRAQPKTVAVSGHTHRHRRRTHGAVTVAEVGSSKDYPGIWSGYEVYEGGLVQIVRRVERPDCLAWTERTGSALAGIWGRWSAGTIDDRCFTRRWA